MSYSMKDTTEWSRCLQDRLRQLLLFCMLIPVHKPYVLASRVENQMVEDSENLLRGMHLRRGVRMPHLKLPIGKETLDTVVLAHRIETNHTPREG